MFFLGFCAIPPTIVIVPIFMGTIPFILKIKPKWFSFFTLVFTNHFVCYRHSANTYNVLAIIFWPWTGFNPTREFQPFTTNGLPILGKGQSPMVPLHLSFPKTEKSLINSLCLHSLACIWWFPLTFFPFLVKMLSQQAYSQKWSWQDTKSRSFPPFHQTIPSIPHWSWALLLCMAGM